MTGVAWCLAFALMVAWWLLRGRADVSPLFALAMLVYLALWNIFPLLYGTTLLDWSASFTEYPRYQRIVVLHLATLLATVALFLLLPSRIIRGPRLFLGTVRTSPRAATWALTLGMFVYAIGVKQATDLRGASYTEATAFVMNADAATAGRVAILDTISYFVLCLAMACIVGTWPNSSRRIAVLAWGIVAIDVVTSLTAGARAVILLPLALLIAVSLQRARDGRPTRWKLVVLTLSVTVLVAPLLAAAISVIRLQGSDSIDIAAVQAGYDVAVANLTLEDKVRLAAQELNTKFDAFSYGASLLENDGESTAGWKPYSSALLAPIPRLLLPDKPVPTSKNGENSGTPYRVAGQPFGSTELGMVTPVSPIAVAIWELGVWGIVLVVVLNVIAWVFANSLLSAPSIFGRALGVSMLALPSTEFFFAAPSGVVRDMPRTLLYLVAIWTVIQTFRVVRRTVPSYRSATVMASTSS